METFLPISPYQEFFSKIRLYDFSTFIVPYLHLKNQKFLRTISEKTALPTNQPTNQLLPTTPILYDLADAGPKKEDNSDNTNQCFDIFPLNNAGNSFTAMPSFSV